jgi:hypothetical protein
MSPCIKPVEPPPVCQTADACRQPPTPQPEVFGAPASATFAGPGNFPPTPAAKPAVKKKTVKCKKGFVKNKHGKCIKRKKTNRKRRK